MKAAFAGSFAARMIEPVRARLSVPCELVAGDESPPINAIAERAGA